MSAQAKCDQMPTILAWPAASAARAAATTPGQSAAVAPPRLMPVSASRCSRAGRPARAASAAIRRTSAAVPAVRSTPAAMARACGASGVPDRQSTGTVKPASRSAMASASWTTPSQVAPPASAADAEGSMPWP